VLQPILVLFKEEAMIIVIETVLLIIALSGWVIAIRKKDPSDVTQAVNDLKAARKELELVRKDMERAVQQVLSLSTVQQAQIEQVNTTLLLSSGHSQPSMTISKEEIDELTRTMEKA